MKTALLGIITGLVISHTALAGIILVGQPDLTLQMGRKHPTASTQVAAASAKPIAVKGRRHRLVRLTDR